MKSTAQHPTQDFSNLIGLEYEKINCWELTKKFYSEILNIELKHYYEDVPKDREEAQSLVYTNKGDFVKSEIPQFGDIVLMKIRGLESHIGVCVGEDLMLHTTKKTGSVVCRMSSWRNNIVGYYRIK